MLCYAKIKTLIGIVVLVLFSCIREKEHVIPHEVEGYVASFFLDARKYGRDLSLEDFDLIVHFTKIEESGVGGRCNNRKNIIEIDSVRWNSMPDEAKEQLIYHELGHCILNRDHDNGQFVNGECKSIMRGGIGSECSVNFFSSSWKEYYKYELFTEEGNLPSWYDLNASVALYDSSAYNYLNIDTILIDGRLKVEGVPFDQDADFQICLTFYDWNINENCVHLFWGDDKKLFLCENGLVSIMQNTSGQVSLNFYYDSFLGIDPAIPLSLCVKRKAGFYYFFANSQLFHVMDYEEWAENVIYTSSFDGVIHMNFMLFNF